MPRQIHPEDVVRYWRVTTFFQGTSTAYVYDTEQRARDAAIDYSAVGEGCVTVMRPVFLRDICGLSFECYYNGRKV